MEGRLERCRGILGALLPTSYLFKLDAKTGTLSYALSKNSIDQPLKEIDLTYATVKRTSDKIHITTFDGGSFKLKANNDGEATLWTTKIREVIEEQTNRMRIPDGESTEEILVESPDMENSSDVLPETESEISRTHQMRPNSERIKEMAKQRFSTTTGSNIERKIREMNDSAPKLANNKSKVSPSEDSTPKQFARIKQYVVTIDFGTSYSGYVYQDISSHKRNPAGGYTEMWLESNGLSQKTPTTLLLTKNGTFEAFGYEAEKRYLGLIENDQAEGWKFFQKFKMRIFKEHGLNRQFEIKDDQGKSMPAVTVFGLSIEFLKQRAFENIKASDPEMVEENIFYVITVPAIWCEKSRQFMLDAMRMAGIDDDQAILAKEPEVAGMYCKEKQLEVHHTNKRMDQQDNAFTFEKESKFVVVDLGGGTADVTVQQVIDDGRMKILRSASGGPWGGSKPDEEFIRLMMEITGRNDKEELLKENREGYYEMLQEWETKKRISTVEGITYITLRMPTGIISQITDEDVLTSRGTVRVLGSRGKVRINFITFKSLFNDTVKNIVEHLKQMEEEGSFENINVMFMVGGFSSNIFIQDAIRKTFPDMTIIVPKDPSLAVLFGGVAYGFQPNAIEARRSSSHYGIEENGRFTQLIHKGQEIPVGVIVLSYKTKLMSGMDGFHIKIFASDEDTPPERVEQCRSIGEIFIRMYRAHGRIEKEIKITIYFDHTEMKVQATDMRTDRVFKTSCNFLER